MKLINSSVEFIEQNPGVLGAMKQIELAGRTCYKSEHLITEDSYKRLLDIFDQRNHCYRGDVELLTENGWIRFDQYSGEKVATVSSDLSFNGYETPSRIITYNYSGKFYEYPDLGIEVTDQHDMFGLFRTQKSDFYNSNNYFKFKSATPFVDNNGRRKTLGERMFKCPRCCNTPTVTNPFFELVGFWIGDGCITNTKGNCLNFPLIKSRKIKYLTELCNLLGYEIKVNRNNSYSVKAPKIGTLFKTSFTKNKHKYIAKDYTQNSNDLYSIYCGLINSDGSLRSHSSTIDFCTTSPYIADWINSTSVLIGIPVNSTYRESPIENQLGTYNFRFLNRKYSIVNDSRKPETKVRITNKTQPVYCVTVSTGLILVRGTNGVTTVCGNCSPLEHGAVYLTLNRQEMGDLAFTATLNGYYNNPYSVVNTIDNPTTGLAELAFITTNMRVIKENGYEDDLSLWSEPTEWHEKRFSFRITCSRAIANEIVRHRVMSFCQESQRYCAYNKDKFGNEITFITPEFIKNCTNPGIEVMFNNALMVAETRYMQMITAGCTAQEARDVLPNACKTEIVVTGFKKDWDHFLELRDSDAAHPDIRVIAKEIKNILNEKV